MELQIPEIKYIYSEITELRKDLVKILEDINTTKLPEWLNDRQCWELKGGCAFNTYRNNRFFQVKGGIPDGVVGGRKVWRKDSVLEWLSLSDDQLEEYHKKYKTGAKRK